MYKAYEEGGGCSSSYIISSTHLLVVLSLASFFFSFSCYTSLLSSQTKLSFFHHLFVHQSQDKLLAKLCVDVFLFLFSTFRRYHVNNTLLNRKVIKKKQENSFLTIHFFFILLNSCLVTTWSRFVGQNFPMPMRHVRNFSVRE